MAAREMVQAALRRRNPKGGTVVGTVTSTVCMEMMEEVGVRFPDAHMDHNAMATLAAAGHTLLGMDIVVPMTSVCHESAALGCEVDWGGPEAMPSVRRPLYARVDADEISIPPDFLSSPACRVPLEAIRRLRKGLGDRVAICGKALGGWTLSYHLFGLENFLVATLEHPEKIPLILERLLPVTEAFARAQLEAGADCVSIPDHATGDVCSPEAYRRFLQPVHAELARRIPAPIMLHICGDTSDRVDAIAATGAAGFHWDTKSGPAQRMRALAGERLALIGGISNALLLDGTPDQIVAQAAEAAAAGIDIIGPECTVPVRTPLRNLMAIAEVRRLAATL